MPKSPPFLGSSTRAKQRASSGKCGVTELPMGALVAASFGPPPMCMPMLTTFTAAGGSAGAAALDAGAAPVAAGGALAGAPLPAALGVGSGAATALGAAALGAAALGA